MRPGAAIYSKDLGEFILPYDDVRQSENPGEGLLEFAQTTYEAAADLGNWDRSVLERGRDVLEALGEGPENKELMP